MPHENALKALHAGRAYHGWQHVEALLALWREYEGILHDAEAVRLAILFHDAVYDPRRSDNERASAALLRDWMAGTVPPARLEAAAAMVLATERHAVPENLPPELAADTASFLDMDLSILGAEPGRFDAYDRAIRQEYAHVPAEAYRTGRAAILRRLLARDPIFLTAPFRARFEDAARRNLQAALTRFESPQGPSMPDYNTVNVPAPALEDMIRGIFLAIGCAGEEAGDIASHLVGSNLAGHDSHGVVRVPRYVDWHKAGYLHAGRKPEVVTDGGAFLLLDAQFGFGHAVTKQGVAMGIARAKQHGAAVVALRNSGHCGRIGTYAEQALAEDLISIHFVNVAGSFLVAPYGGVDRRFSTAPIAIGVPLEGRPVVLDFATSLVAEGKVLVASNGGKPLPPDALIEPDGRFSGDPHTLYGDYPQVGARIPGNGPGAIRAFGDHKGSGLALMCELLAGAFTGGGTSGPRDQRGCIANGLLSIYLSPAHFGTEAEFQRMGREYLEWVTGSRPIDPASPVMLPGEPEKRSREKRLREGLPLPADIWEDLRRTATSLGVAVPAV
ncbi:malate/lactate/ureidoglycolate dehydrogenase [Pseudoroseomonas ludipueritiae]